MPCSLTSIIRTLLRLFVLLALAACAVPATAPNTPVSPGAGARPGFDPEIAAKNFLTVVERVEPVAEAECRRREPNRDCDIKIYVDDRRGAPPNAYQTIDPRGRPAIIFTLALIVDARNQDELAFILGHEAGHHIAGHLPKTQASAEASAVLLGSLAEAAGQSDAMVRRAVEIGAVVGARRFAREFELEADAIGTVIAARAGYDPIRGAAFFDRIPDPGDQFLGSHPPNAERRAIVRRTAAGL